jgi:hypothetical protein
MHRDSYRGVRAARRSVLNIWNQLAALKSRRGNSSVTRVCYPALFSNSDTDLACTARSPIVVKHQVKETMLAVADHLLSLSEAAQAEFETWGERLMSRCETAS